MTSFRESLEVHHDDSTTLTDFATLLHRPEPAVEKIHSKTNLTLEGHDNENGDSNGTTDDKNNTTKLVVTFVSFVFIGALTTVSSKLMAMTMYNYPNFLNIWGCVLFVPLCFVYILPAIRYGTIPPEQTSASKQPFVIMAIFDTLATTLITFASVYLPGPLLVLLPQASIPTSMILSKLYLKSSYGCWQYVGSSVVILGIMVVLEPVLTNRHAPDYVCVALDEVKDCAVCQDQLTQDSCLGYSDYSDDNEISSPLQQDSSLTFHLETAATQACKWIESSHETSGTSTLIFWSFMLLLSCIPSSMSSIYKEHQLGETEWDPVYLNGWIALYQVPMSALLAIPGGLVSSPPVPPLELPSHFWDGMKCFFGHESIKDGCHPDDCRFAMLAICANLIICFAFTNLMILLLKYSSANLMFLAMTCIVPLANLAFALPFMPGRVALHASDLIGLFVIVFGIVSYRFGSVICGGDKGDPAVEEKNAEINDLEEPLLSLESLGLEVEKVDE